MLITFTAWTRQFPAAMVYTLNTETGEIVCEGIDRQETQAANDSGEMAEPWFWEQFPETIYDYDIVVDDIAYVVGFDPV